MLISHVTLRVLSSTENSLCSRRKVFLASLQIAEFHNHGTGKVGREQPYLSYC